ncbi:uncharacterized protein LOC135306832 [Passer domesticus]|uniref:uncharacterized protein LOC135306832 n=1 Tax=Passer domesticus TaxID=48849 RepID=UPI0030FF2FF9
MDKDWEYDTDQELSQWGHIARRRRCLWEEMTAQEYYRLQDDVMIQDISSQGVGRHQELHQRCKCKRGVSVRVQWGDATQQEQEGEEHQEPSPLEEVQGHPDTFQQEGDKTDPELSQVADKRDKDLSQGKDYNVQELPQWEEDGSDQKLPQQEVRLSHWEEGIDYKIWDKPLHPEKDEDAQTCTEEGPTSPSSMGTEVAGEAAHELPRTSSALGSPTEDELAATAALAGADEEEEPPKPLPAEVEKAPGSPALREEEPSAVAEKADPASCYPPDSSQALLDLARHISYDIVHKALLVIQESGQQPEEQRDLEQSRAAELEAATEGGRREESPILALHSPLGAQAPSEEQEEADEGSVLAEQEPEEGPLAGELELPQYKDEEHTELSQGEINKYQEGSQGEASTEQELSLDGDAEAQSHHELSDWDECIEEELSHGDAGSYQEISDWEEAKEQDQSLEEAQSHHELSDWDEYIEEELSHGDAGSYQEISDWEEAKEQDQSLEEAQSHHDLSDWDEYVGEELSHGDAGSYQEISDWEEGTEQDIEQKLSSEEARSHHELSDWDECTGEELSYGDGSYHEISDWEEGTGKDLSQGPVGSSQNLSDWEEDSKHELPHEDITRYQEVSDWEESIGQGVSKKRPSCLQRALRALRGLFCPCLAPQPED